MTDTEFSAYRADAVRRELITYAIQHGDARRRRLRTWGVALGAGATGAALSTAAFATTGNLGASAPPLLPGEPTHVEGNAQASAYLEALALEPGFQGSGDAADDLHDVMIIWHGPLSTRAKALLAEATAEGIDVDVRYVIRSEDEAWAAVVECVRALQEAGIEVSSFGLTDLYTSLRLSGPKISSDPTAQQRARDLVREVLGDDFDVTFIPEEEYAPAIPRP